MGDVQTITSNYGRDDILGQGGFGTVFKGTLRISVDTDDGVETSVAIKRLEKARLNETITVDRELVQKKLNHPNVVKLYHVEENENFL